LREAREALGISQRNLGIKAGIDEFVASPRINRYEKGVHHPHLQIQQKLAQVLEVPLAYFYAEDDELAQMIRTFKSKGRQRRRTRRS
jgi:transcriptional regulator with XRE-family HTH domain